MNFVRLLVVDNDKTSSDRLAELLENERYNVTIIASTEEATQSIMSSNYDIVLADSMLSGKNSFTFLKEIRKLKPELPVVFISNNISIEMVRRAFKEGACDFIAKPYNELELPVIIHRNLVRSSIEYRREIDHKLELQKTYRAMLDILLTAVDLRDAETEGHSERVAAYTMIIAQRMGFPLPDLIHIERGALLHDIGKIGVPDHILRKPSGLTDDEWVLMRQHPIIGYNMCKRMDALSKASEIILNHHERYDGKGYPNGLMKSEIPLGARIFSIVDSFDAMTSDRPYRKAMDYKLAIDEIHCCSGTQFDPEIVDVFTSIPINTWSDVKTLLLEPDIVKAA